jgi:ketosteroid isomerase-like protein
MSERENVELMRRAFAAWNRRDIETALELMDPDVEWHPNLQLPDVDPIYRGRNGVRRFFKDFMDPWDTITVEPLETTARGDEVVACRSRHRLSAA